MRDREPASDAAAAASGARDVAISALPFLAVLFAFYAASFPGFRTTNEGSQYALVRAFSAGRLDIDPYADYTRYVDYAKRGAHYYSDKPPGTATLALPFYEIGRVIGGRAASQRRPLPALVPARDPANALVPPFEEWTTDLVVALAGTVTVLLVLLTAVELGASRAAAAYVAAAAGLGTMLWRYATVMYSHALSAALVMAAVYLAVRSLTRPSTRRSVLLGIVAGVAVAVDYSTVALVGPVIVVLIAVRLRRGVREAIHDAVAIAAGAVGPVVLLAAYQWAAFGSPLHTSYTYKQLARFAFTHSIRKAYSAPISHIWEVLFDPTWGSAVWNPLLFLAPVGLAFAWRSDRRAGVLLAAASVPLFLLVAKFRTPEGGGTFDARYVTPALAPLVLSLALPLTRLTRPAWRAGAWLVAWIFLAGSVVLQGARLLLMQAHAGRVYGGAPLVVASTVRMQTAAHDALVDAFPSIRWSPIALVAGLVVAFAIRRGAGRRQRPTPS